MCSITAVLVGAAVGAVAGAGSAALAGGRGGDILKGALFGGLMGAVGGGAGAAYGAAAGGAAGSFLTSGAVHGIATGVKVGYWAGTVGGGLAGGYAGGRISASIGMQQRVQLQAEKAQADAIKKLQENQGTLEVNKTATMSGNARVNRTLSSLRISMLPQKQDNHEVIQNAFGVDSNLVTTPTQNMVGLSIAA